MFICHFSPSAALLSPFQHIREVAHVLGRSSIVSLAHDLLDRINRRRVGDDVGCRAGAGLVDIVANVTNMLTPATRQRVPLRQMLHRHGEKVSSSSPSEKHNHHNCGQQQPGLANGESRRLEDMSFGLARLGLTKKTAFLGRLNQRHERGTSSSGSGSSLSLEYEDDESHVQNLLPGIPDRVTIEGILTKTSWRTLCTLSAVNRSWRQTIQSRRVYQARNCLNSTKSLVIVSHRASAAPAAPQNSSQDPDASFLTRSGRFVPSHWRYAISLYDPNENAWHCLPPIPGVSSGLPKSCGCLFLNGKVYVIGGDDYDKLHSKREVYMLDLAACRGVWQQCASMTSGRSEFPCALHNGRIYVFGGGYQPEVNYSRDVEVFDPERNEWHPIPDTMHQRTKHTAVSLEEKLYVLGGSVWLDEDDDLLYQTLDCDDMFDSTLLARFAEVYDPWKQNWRKVENVTKRETDDAFVVVHDKLHVLRPDSVHVYDTTSNSWSFLQHISWEVQACSGAKDCCVCAAAFVEGELLALVGMTREEDYGLILLRSRNFHRRSCQVTWEAIQFPQQLDSQFFSICPVQL